MNSKINNEIPAEINDGGPAFPVRFMPVGEVDLGLQGMSLRDWFAGMALQGLCCQNILPRTAGDAASVAYEVADAMLSERSKS